MASAFVANTVVHSATSLRQRLSARVLSADTAARSTNSWQRCFLESAFVANAVVRSTTSLQQRLLARVLSADTAAQSADSWQRCSLASTFVANAIACSASSWQQCSLASLANTFFCVVAACCHCSSAIATRVQHSCSYRRQARAASRCCRRAVFQARQIWRQRRQSQRRTVVAAEVRHALAAHASKRRWQHAVSLLRSR